MLHNDHFMAWFIASFGHFVDDKNSIEYHQRTFSTEWKSEGMWHVSKVMNNAWKCALTLATLWLLRSAAKMRFKKTVSASPENNSSEYVNLKQHIFFQFYLFISLCCTWWLDSDNVLISISNFQDLNSSLLRWLESNNCTFPLSFPSVLKTLHNFWRRVRGI